MRSNARCGLLALVAALLASGAPAAASAAACDSAGSTEAAGLPSAEELETRLARIGSIDIEVQDIFDPTQAGERAAPYRWVNQMHLSTREDAVRSQLLFHESDAYSRQKISETERLLRGRRYLFDAWIEPACYHPQDNIVDLHVRVRDVWSLNPGLHFSRKGGANNTGFELQDQDFLGRGSMVSVGWASNVDRSSVLFDYDDPQLFGSWWRARAAYADNSDGSFGNLAIERPFYSLDTRWSAGTRLAGGSRTDSRYQLGKVLDEFTQNVEAFDAYGGVSDGLRDGWSRRWLGGVRYERDTFEAIADETLAAPLPADRKFVYPWAGFELVEDDFQTTRNQDQLARTEDLKFGRSLRAELGLAAPAWGSDQAAAMFALYGDAGRRVAEAESLFFTGGLNGRWQSDGLRDVILQGETRYYRRQRPNLLLYADARAAVAQALDLDHQLLLGGDNGLRGYPLRYQSGTASALFTVEERYFTDWQPFHLFHVGAAVFADAGRTWGRDIAGETPLGWLSDVGVGLRIGNSRTGLGNVLHIDVAVPLVTQPGIDSVQLIVETRRSF
jgi:hypothetical protein